ncbi:M60 family metallopeptidase [Pseudomonas sp. 3A(2025)]
MPGATIEAQWPNGVWASIGTVHDDLLSNPNVPAAYCLDSKHMRLRIQGVENTEVTVAIIPALVQLSARLNDDARVSVTGATTLTDGIVEALSDGQWKGIGEVVNGRFFNPSVPRHYLYTQDSIRVRVQNGLASSNDMISTLGFAHPPSVLVHPLLSSAAEQAMMHWLLPKADYQPTGYFAPAGVEVEVWAWGNVENVTLLVGTQGMADREHRFTRSADMRATRLVRGRNVIQDPLGGVIHIRNLAGSGSGAARIMLRYGAKPIPYYLKGSTTAAQWREMLTASEMPEVELVGRHIVVAAFRDTALRFLHVNPAETVEAHEEVMRIQAQVSGLDESAPLHTRSSLLLYAVESSASASPHAGSGYIGFPCTPGVSVFNQALAGGQATRKWVALHEHGHHCQTSCNSCGPFAETSVNLYALAVGRLFPNEYTDVFPDRWPATQQWLALPRADKNYGAPESDPQAIFEQLRKGLGEYFLPAWHRHIRENPCPSPGLKDFVLSASIVARYDLTDFFAEWGVLKATDTEVWSAVAELDLPHPPMKLTAVRPYAD